MIGAACMAACVFLNDDVDCLHSNGQVNVMIDEADSLLNRLNELCATGDELVAEDPHLFGERVHHCSANARCAHCSAHVTCVRIVHYALHTCRHAGLNTKSQFHKDQNLHMHHCLHHKAHDF